MTTLIALLAFPCCAILWLLLCDRLGMVRDEPLIDDQERGLAARKRHAVDPAIAVQPVLSTRPRTSGA
jgi:hypothetical protein